MERILGIHAVRQALLSKTGECLIVRKGELNSRQQELVDLARQMNVPVRQAAVQHEAIADQGVALEVLMPKFQTENELAARIAEKGPSSLFLVLDGVTDPRNFGACLRSAASFGVTGVIVPKDKSAPLNDAAIKTASGAASLVSMYQVVNLVRALERLKQAGVWVVGTTLTEGAQALADIDLRGDIALVMGAEGRGIRQGTQKHCDFLAEIPAQLPELSLNVAVAAGICLYEAHRQRAG